MRVIQCPWCGKSVIVTDHGDPCLPVHDEPQREWTSEPPECVAAGVFFSVAEGLADIRDREGGGAFRLRAHP